MKVLKLYRKQAGPGKVFDEYEIPAGRIVCVKWERDYTYDEPDDRPHMVAKVLVDNSLMELLGDRYEWIDV